MNAVSILELQWFLIHLDEEQADSADRIDLDGRVGYVDATSYLWLHEVQGQVLPQKE